MNRLIGEILEMVHNASGKNEMKQILIDNQPPYLLSFLEIAFNENIQWSFRPGGIELPPITVENPPQGISETGLHMELRRLMLFQDGRELPVRKRQELLIQMVESLPRFEAEILLALVQGKKLPIRGFTKNFMLELNPRYVTEKVA